MCGIVETASSPKIILMDNQKSPALNQRGFKCALKLLDKELEQGRECYILLSEKKHVDLDVQVSGQDGQYRIMISEKKCANLNIQVLEKYNVLVSGYFDYSMMDCGEADSAKIVKWFNKELLDKLNIKYHDKIQ